MDNCVTLFNALHCPYTMARYATPIISMCGHNTASCGSQCMGVEVSESIRQLSDYEQRLFAVQQGSAQLLHV